MTRRHRSRLGLIGLLLTGSLLAAACGDDGDSDDNSSSEDTTETTAASGSDGGGSSERLNLTMGGSTSSSSVYAFLTAQARLAGELDGNMNVNIRETGASAENIQLLKDGSVDFGVSGLSTVIQANRGLGDFEGSAYEDLCLVQAYLKNAEFITVRADAGIDSLEDLDGKDFAPSFQGSALYDNMLAYFEVLGIEVKVFDGGLEDIVNAIKDGRIVGFGKSGNGMGADASMLDVAADVNVKTIGFTQEQIDKILAAQPQNELLYQFTEIPAGSVFDNKEPFLTPVVIATYFADKTKISEDAAYRLAKSFYEVQEEAAEQTNYVGAMGITTDDSIEASEKLPFCAGADRFFEEAAG